MSRNFTPSLRVIVNPKRCLLKPTIFKKDFCRDKFAFYSLAVMSIVERKTNDSAKVCYCPETLPQALWLGLSLTLAAETNHFQN